MKNICTVHLPNSTLGLGHGRSYRGRRRAWRPSAGRSHVRTDRWCRPPPPGPCSWCWLTGRRVSPPGGGRRHHISSEAPQWWNISFTSLSRNIKNNSFSLSYCGIRTSMFGWLLALEWIIPDIVNLFTLSHHILVSVCQVYNGGSAFYVGQSVGDGVFLDAGVVHRPRTLPRHQQAGEVVRRRLDVLRLWTAHWQKEKKNFVYRWFTQKHQ